MCSSQCVLALLALYVGLAHSFSWDLAVSRRNGLSFYFNETLMHTEIIPSADIPMMTYDEIHNRVLFLDIRNESSYIASFDITTKKVHSIVKTPPYRYVRSFVYEPVTDLLFWSDGWNIHTLTLQKPEKDGNTIIETKDLTQDIAVDSCGGFIYWISERVLIKRARFDGSERKIVVDEKTKWLYGLNIDQQTQRMYWVVNEYTSDINYDFSIRCADFNGMNVRTLYKTKLTEYISILTISKDYVYWGSSPGESFHQLPKKLLLDDVKSIYVRDLHPKEINHKYYTDIITNYKIEDQLQGIENCERLRSLLPKKSNVSDANFCLHGTTVNWETICECEQGYTGERCEVVVCHNYCLQGNCSVSAEGQPKCKCNVGYSGERCEVNLCQGYCLNNGVCSLNETGEAVCQCAGDYQGDRCQVPVFLIKSSRAISMLKDLLNTDETSTGLDNVVEPTCTNRNINKNF